MRARVVGVMGPGVGATPQDLERARDLGRAIAQAGWILLTGGMNQGVMAAAVQGAKEAGGWTVGVVPTEGDVGVCPDLDLVIRTGMGHARNLINVLSSDVVVACGMGAGTASEVALALKTGRPVILLTDQDEAQAFFQKLGGKQVMLVSGVGEAVTILRCWLSPAGGRTP